MTSTFTITTTAPETLKADARGHAEVVFTVTNTTSRPARAMARPKALDSTKQEWLQITGETDRDFPAGATQQFAVTFNAPVSQTTPSAATPAGSSAPAEKYRFQLLVALATNPDEDFALSSPIRVELPVAEPIIHKPFPKWIFIPIAVVVLLGIGLGLYFALRKKDVQVPNVVGMNFDDASAALSKVKLNPVQAEAQFTGNHQVGEVIAQDPKPEDPAVPKGTDVKLTVEVAEPLVEVPDVTRRLIDDAKARLKEKGLSVVETSTDVSEGLQVNQVVSQNPAAGQQVKANSTVELVVAVQRQIAVPDVTFRPADLAQQQITAAGLKFVMKDPELAPSNVAPGNIKSQNPGGGEKVPPGATVELVAAAQPTTVPAIIGRTIGQAQIALQQAGLELGNIFGSIDQSNANSVTITGSTPGQGSTVARGSKVNVSVPQNCNTPRCIMVTDFNKVDRFGFRVRQP